MITNAPTGTGLEIPTELIEKVLELGDTEDYIDTLELAGLDADRDELENTADEILNEFVELIETFIYEERDSK